MSSARPQQCVLSEAIEQAIGERRIKVAVFLTFQFDPGFFETEVLPLLFDQSFSLDRATRLAQLEDALTSIGEHVAVYYDRRGLIAGSPLAGLDYRRIGLSRSGYFHPKNILLLVENRNGDDERDSLLVATLSANLTRSGWWANLEAAHIEEVWDGSECTFRKDLLDLIAFVKHEDHTAQRHTALEEVRRFLVYRVSGSGLRRQGKHRLPRLYVGKQSVPDFLKAFIPTDTFNLEIISPYFDDSDSIKTVDDLIRATGPKETRIFLPRADDGTALCRRGFFEGMQKMPRVKWAYLPDDLRKSVSDKSNSVRQFVHAKVYRFWNKTAQIMFVGSVNLTRPAHQGNDGNFETGVLVKANTGGRSQWWLETLTDAHKPTEFRSTKAEDTDSDLVVGEVSIRFDWNSSRLDYFWEETSGAAPRRADISASGIHKWFIEPIQFGTWTVLPRECATLIQELLISTSFVEVSSDGDKPFLVLIREEGMAHKPSRPLSLKTEDILQSWSLLSLEQRESFLNAHIMLQPSDISEYTPKLDDSSSTESMFDRFAGIFHAFNRLDRHVDEALHTQRENEAVYRLFGQKYDSLPALLDKVIEDKKSSAVNRYVILLCAKQLLNKVEQGYPDFKRKHRAEFENVRKQTEAIGTIRDAITFGAGDERSRFFDWYEKMFLHEFAADAAEKAA